MVMVIPVVAGGLLGIAALAQLFTAARQKPVGSTVTPGAKKDEKKKTPGKPQIAAAAAAGAYGAGKGLSLIAKVLWTIGAMIMALLLWLLFKPKKQVEDVDFYAGALDIPLEDAKKMSRAYLAGKLSAKRKEEKYGSPDKILGLQPTSIQATYGKQFQFEGSKRW